VPLPPILGVPPLVPGPPAMPGSGPISGSTPIAANGGSGAHAVHVGGETRRTQPQAAVLDALPPLPSIPPPAWSDPPPIPVPSGPTAPTGPTSGPHAVTTVRGARRRWRFGRFLGAAVLWFLVWGTWKVGGEMRVWNESDLLGRKVHAAEPEALDEMVAAYSSLSERSSFGWGTWPARQPLREALTLHVDRVILDFRQPEPTVRQNQWRQARAWAAKALELGADDQLRARYLLCDAHVKRIDGDAAIRSKDADRGNRLLNEADSQFREASRLTRANPDAWLGLLRLHSGARSDPDKAQEDLNEAARRGWTPGARDYFLIGESTRNRADAIEKGCDEQRTNERVKECLTRARDLLKKAIDWYDKAEGLAAAARGGVLAQRSLDRIETRLETLEEFSMKGLGLDLLNLAIRHSRKEAEARDGDEHPATPKP
jgi:tetratricopeptide (TPR) repeat protein